MVSLRPLGEIFQLRCEVFRNHFAYLSTKMEGRNLLSFEELVLLVEIMTPILPIRETFRSNRWYHIIIRAILTCDPAMSIVICHICDADALKIFHCSTGTLISSIQ